eukprot:SAG25_NODE_997_length_4356_cov_40.321118_4_plen_533_part_00
MKSTVQLYSCLKNGWTALHAVLLRPTPWERARHPVACVPAWRLQRTPVPRCWSLACATLWQFVATVLAADGAPVDDPHNQHVWWYSSGMSSAPQSEPAARRSQQRQAGSRRKQPLAERIALAKSATAAAAAAELSSSLPQQHPPTETGHHADSTGMQQHRMDDDTDHSDRAATAAQDLPGAGPTPAVFGEGVTRYVSPQLLGSGPDSALPLRAPPTARQVAVAAQAAAPPPALTPPSAPASNEVVKAEPKGTSMLGKAAASSSGGTEAALSASTAEAATGNSVAPQALATPRATRSTQAAEVDAADRAPQTQSIRVRQSSVPGTAIAELSTAIAGGDSASMMPPSVSSDREATTNGAANGYSRHVSDADTVPRQTQLGKTVTSPKITAEAADVDVGSQAKPADVRGSGLPPTQPPHYHRQRRLHRLQQLQQAATAKGRRPRAPVMIPKRQTPSRFPLPVQRSQLRSSRQTSKKEQHRRAARSSTPKVHPHRARKIVAHINLGQEPQEDPTLDAKLLSLWCAALSDRAAAVPT